jgi:hypothetical protein
MNVYTFTSPDGKFHLPHSTYTKVILKQVTIESYKKRTDVMSDFPHLNPGFINMDVYWTYIRPNKSLFLLVAANTRVEESLEVLIEYNVIFEEEVFIILNIVKKIKKERKITAR